MQLVVQPIFAILVASLSVEEIGKYWDAAGMYPPEKIMPYFESGTHEYRGTVFEYQLYKPIDDDGPYPMIVWMHGYGDEEFSQKNAGQLRHLGYFFKNCNPHEHDFYLLAMQLPKPPGAWFGGSPEASEVLIDLIERLTEEYAVDENRIHLVGVSGGSMVMDVALRHPKTFASIVPISSRKCDFSLLPTILDIPVWAFHREEDKPPVNEVQEMVDEIKRLGGTAHLTVFPGFNHDAWRPAFHSCDLLNWLLNQERGGTFQTPPGYVPWKWWQLVGQVGLPAIVGLASAATIARFNRRSSWLRRYWISILLTVSVLSLGVSASSGQHVNIRNLVDVRTWSITYWRVALIATVLWMLVMLYLMRRSRRGQPCNPILCSNDLH